MAAARMDYEPAGELKIGQVGIANLRVRTLDVERLAEEMRERVSRAPRLFARAAVVLDFGGLARAPDRATAQALIDALREAGVLPVALAYGTSENDALAQALGLPLLAKFRASYEPAGAAKAATDTAVEAPVATGAAPAGDKGEADPAPAPPSSPGLVQLAPVRSGQQLYADNRDLTVLAAVGAGAEVISDGSIHIYGPLRGRALAGAQGNEKARIFCRELHAELVAVAGHYKVLDEIAKELRGKPAQVWLDGGQLRVESME
jgi:septum site-determining protein MinC